MKLTEHFSMEELITSDTALRRGIDQTPPPAVAQALRDTASQMEVVRALLGNRPIIVNSGYRSPMLNKIVGGAANSDHLRGMAVDFTCPEFGTPLEIVKFLASQPTLQFDQLIQEGTWVHISFAPGLRREILTAHFGPAGTTYSKGVA